MEFLMMDFWYEAYDRKEMSDWFLSVRKAVWRVKKSKVAAGSSWCWRYLELFTFKNVQFTVFLRKWISIFSIKFSNFIIKLKIKHEKKKIHIVTTVSSCWKFFLGMLSNYWSFSDNFQLICCFCMPFTRPLIS